MIRGFNDIGVLVGDRFFFDRFLRMDPSQTFLYEFQFQIQTRSSFSASLTPAPVNRNYALELRDTNGTVLARSNNPDDATDVIVTTLEPGTYTIQVPEKSVGTGMQGLGLSLKAEFDFGTQFVWRNNQTDQTANWSFNTDRFKQGEFFSAMPQVESGWKLIDTFDLPTQGDRTLVWRNDEIDQTALWKVSGNQFKSGEFLKSSSVQLPSVDQNSGWKLISSGLTNGNLRLVWGNATTGETGIWNFNDQNEFVSGSVLKNAPKIASGWELIDSIETGKSEFGLVWRNAATNQTGIWNISNDEFVSGSIVTGTPIASENPDWKLLKASTFNNNTLLLWRNAVSDETGVWLLNGDKYMTGKILTNAPKLGSDSAWQIVGLSNQLEPLTPPSLGSRSGAFDFGLITGKSRFVEPNLPANQSLSYVFRISNNQRLTLSSSNPDVVYRRIDPAGVPVTTDYVTFPLGSVDLKPVPDAPKAPETTYTLELINRGNNPASIDISFEPPPLPKPRLPIS